MREKTLGESIKALIYQINARISYLEDALEVEEKHNHKSIADNFDARRNELIDWQEKIQGIINEFKI
jgi:hypothetical protein